MRVVRLVAVPLLFVLPACSGAATSALQVAPDATVDVVAPLPDVVDEPEAAPDPSGPPYPIVLVHGMGGFGTLKGLNITYFNGIKDDLAAHGETSVFTPLTTPYDTSEVRAGMLAPQIDQILAQTGKAKVNLIGHSQGGMDIRVLVSPNGMGYGPKVASVTTISTPHHGSQVGDVAEDLINDIPANVASDVTNALLNLLEITVYDLNDPDQANIKAQVTEMSEHNMVTVFNPKYIDDPSVPYFSYAGRSDDLDGLPDCESALYPDDPTKLDDGQAILLPTMEFLKDGSLDKPNDGLVTVQSGRWGTFMQCVPADHMSEVGQINIDGTNAKSGFNHLTFFELVVQRVRDRGF